MKQSQIITNQIETLEREANELTALLATNGNGSILWDKVKIMSKLGNLADAMEALSTARGFLYSAEKIENNLKSYTILKTV